MTEVVFAVYKPKPRKNKELEKLIKRHGLVLKKLRLITNRPRLIFKSKNGAYIELIEWVNTKAVGRAHTHPTVIKIWKDMEMVCKFKKLADLGEARRAFSHFKVVSYLSN